MGRSFYTAAMLQHLFGHALMAASALLLFSAAAIPGSQLREAGVAKVDITPDYPIRLTGYAVRKTECEGVAQHIYARALALGSDKEKPALLITVDNCGVPVNVREEVVARLHKEKRLDPARIAVCSTHTHSAPWVRGFAPNIFGGPIPAEQQERVDRYTGELTDYLEAVALKALAERRPAKLSRGQGHADFAANRRTKGGPTDHDSPALLVTDPDGTLRAIFTSYACHGTTLGGDYNQICGDWAGYAAEDLEREHPGAVALVALGCAGDSNPNPRPGIELAQQHGQAIATALDAILALGTRPVEGKLVCHAKQIELPFDTLPTRAEWEARAKETNYAGGHARLNLARLARGEKLQTRLPYLVQTWTFGDNLAMVFLAGEVVVDYSLRLKRELDASRLWVNAYANDVPCYIPSERILKEGGYEGGGAMIFYDRPTRLAPGVEDRIVATVRQLLPRGFENPKAEVRDPRESRNPKPETGQRARKAFHVLRFTLHASPLTRHNSLVTAHDLPFAI
ncbi:MAG TPA: neutral/alkaline non-lysosomal ceramidase N-terminal domain-containing protein [Candidatus Binatia bacterium]|jgi:hypothetical protein|nr:neutral/alkaline non-lysosomal ceramidase N-terminal domain-containing protein [Candidatus Binatia bacterium]